MIIVVDKHLPFIESAFGPLGEVRALDTTQLTAQAVRDAQVLIVRSPTKVDRILLDGSGVTFVGTATIGTDHVDLGYLASRKIAFASAPGSNSNSVKEYAVAALLELAVRRLRRLSDLTIGIIGVGHVGSKVRMAATALGMRVLLNDPPLARATGDPAYLPFDELMDADVLTVHVPLTKSGPDPTFHMFGEPAFARMKPGITFINTSRGGVVDTASLKKALADGRVADCVLDVWEHEPDIDVDLLGMAALGTPHIAGYSVEGRTNAVTAIRSAICRHFGLTAPWEPPEPEPGGRTEVVLPVGSNADSHADEQILRGAVSQCYDISLDDRLLRKIASVEPAGRGAYFKGLRAGYRTRREFSHMSVRTAGRREDLLRILGSLGFNCPDEPVRHNFIGKQQKEHRQ